MDISEENIKDFNMCAKELSRSNFLIYEIQQIV
jgi:hypothetical protein